MTLFLLKGISSFAAYISACLITERVSCDTLYINTGNIHKNLLLNKLWASSQHSLILCFKSKTLFSNIYYISNDISKSQQK